MQSSSNSGSAVDPKSDDQSSGSKRRRAPNFTDKEIRILVKLVFVHIEIIESKKTDSETWRVKDLVWNNISESFNNCSGTSKRTVEMIRQKYDSLKKIARKKEAKNREEEYKEEPDFVDMEDYEKELIRLLESIGGNMQQAYEPTTILLSETKFTGTNIKTENSNASQPSNLDLSDFRDDERFVITDEDMLWDLPTDMTNRPRLQLVKKQFEQLGTHYCRKEDPKSSESGKGVPRPSRGIARRRKRRLTNREWRTRTQKREMRLQTSLVELNILIISKSWTDSINEHLYTTKSVDSIVKDLYNNAERKSNHNENYSTNAQFQKEIVEPNNENKSETDTAIEDDFLSRELSKTSAVEHKDSRVSEEHVEESLLADHGASRAHSMPQAEDHTASTVSNDEDVDFLLEELIRDAEEEYKDSRVSEEHIEESLLPGHDGASRAYATPQVEDHTAPTVSDDEDVDVLLEELIRGTEEES